MGEQISIADAMKILQVSKPTIYRLIHAGELHPIKKKVGVGVGGRRVWLDRREVDTLRTANESPAPSTGPASAELKTKRAKRKGK